jgi:hypothetical protein
LGDLLGAGVGAGVLLMLGFGANVLTPGIGANVLTPGIGARVLYVPEYK